MVSVFCNILGNYLIHIKGLVSSLHLLFHWSKIGVVRTSIARYSFSLRPPLFMIFSIIVLVKICSISNFLSLEISCLFR
jgi:hypothetical protein